MIFLFLSILSAATWLAILILPWKPWSVAEVLEPRENNALPFFTDLTVLIPARNEENTISKTIESVRRQGEGIRIIVVDDCSTDRTFEAAKEAVGSSGTIVKGSPLPEGWIGKLWALQQGLARVNTPMVLLLDADILLRPGILVTALEYLDRNRLDLLSLMARLRMKNRCERLFMPAFVYFFKLLYPFALSNRPGTSTAAAAGGFILVRTQVLKRVGAFRSIKGAIIDDCTLASRIKKAGFKTWTGLTHAVISMRCYDGLTDIWRMIRRTAFTQLGYSWLLLFVVTLLMALLFALPVAGVFSMDAWITTASVAALVFMCITYLPILGYYDQPVLLALTLPLVATAYMAMTWSSALNQTAGKGACWKDRCYKKEMS